MGTLTIAYADDIVIMSCGKFLTTLSEMLERSLGTMGKWASRNGLKVNPLKTEMVLFSRNNKTLTRKVKIGGVEITPSDNAKFLGVYLDSKLNWSRNTEERIKKANNAYYACKKMFGTTWGLRPKVTHWIYTAVVRPILLYAVVVWHRALERDVILKRFQTIQRRMGLSITGALGTTSAQSLDTLLHLMPIDVFAKGEAYKACLRLKESNWLKHRNFGHSNFSNMDRIVTDYRVPKLIFDRKYNIRFPTREFWSSWQQNPLDALNIYTDGSKQSEGVGAGFAIMELEQHQSFNLPTHCSIFQAEIVAITKAVEHITGTKGKVMNIYIDSQAALKALLSYSIKSKVVMQCYEKLQHLSQDNQVNLLWVPGHQGIEGNEKADELAKFGAEGSGTALSVQPPIQYYKQKRDILNIKIANRKWQQLTTCKISRIMWPNYDKKRTEYMLSLTRIESRLLTGVVTGHCLIGKHAMRLRHRTDLFCRRCNEPNVEETIEHILCRCPSLSGARNSILGNFIYDTLADVAQKDLKLLKQFAMRTKAFGLHQ